MRWNRQTHFRLAAIGLGVAMAFAQKAAAAGANPMADISPSEIALDQAAELRVDAAGGHAPALPAVDGLHFQRTGQSTEMTAINGVVAQHTWILYQVDADRPGSYTIPIGGRTLQLKVRPAGARGASAASVPMASFRAEPDESSHQGSLALLRVVLPSKKIFVGQAVPVTFKAYFRAGTQITLTGAPSLGISAFTINHLQDEPRQSVESIGGVPYRVVTWTAQASAAMPGRFATRATLPIVARYREASRRPAADPLSGMLDDDDMSSPSSLIRSFMNGRRVVASDHRPARRLQRRCRSLRCACDTDAYDWDDIRADEPQDRSHRAGEPGSGLDHRPSFFCELEDLSTKREGHRPGDQDLRAGGRASIEWPPRNPRCFVQLLRSRPAPVPEPVDRADWCGDRRNPGWSCDAVREPGKEYPQSYRRACDRVATQPLR